MNGLTGLDNITVKEIVRELKIQRKVDLHDNIIRCHGITKLEPENHYALYHTCMLRGLSIVTCIQAIY
ncbi:unnamed protein product [Rhizophagus irregularis]|nr:unnamed protein product [Rhizophagus irregularis]